MAQLKNLFDYATKELSQDAFLMWLFDNYDSDDSSVKEASIGLLNMLGIDTDNITEIETIPQRNHIDISVYIKSGNWKQALFIEDKTMSGEHNQLKEYNKSIIKQTTGISNNDVKRKYYKTSSINKEEEKRVNDAEWSIVPFDDIADFWRPFIDSSNLIIRSYAEHIVKLHAASKNMKRPVNNTTIDLIAWKSYFDKQIIPRFDQQYVCSSNIGRYGYTYLCFWKYGYGKGAPYLEIRSRDCVNNTFKARILTYDLAEKVFVNVRPYFRDNISKNNTSLFTANLGEKRNKQIAVTKIHYENVTEDDDISLIHDALTEYCAIFDGYLKDVGAY